MDCVFLGGGGFALELYEYMSEDGRNVVGYYSQEESEELKGELPWLGDIDRLSQDEIRRDVAYIVAVRLIKYRLKMIRFIEDNGLVAGSFVHSQVYRSKAVRFGKGIVAFPRAMLTGNARIGDFLFIDGLSVISHGDVIGNNVVIGPAVTICGDCSIGDNVTFGVNSAVLPGTIIESDCEVSIGTFPPKYVKADSTIITQPGKNVGNAFNKNFR